MNRNELREYLYMDMPTEPTITYHEGVWSRINDRLLMSPLDELQQACVLQRARTYHNSRFCV